MSHSATPCGSVTSELGVEGQLTDLRLFFLNDQGEYLLDAGASDSRFMRSSSIGPGVIDAPSSMSVITETTASAGTAVPAYGALNMSLSQFCRYVSEHACLRKAAILSTECYVHRAGLVDHRFLLLELHREGRKTIWLRLDRRRGEGVTLFAFLSASGVTKANDTAQLASDRELLIERATRENRQEFATPPILNDLRLLLQIIYEEITCYRIIPENCWFFCSLIQQQFASNDGANFTAGSLPFPSMATNTRIRVRDRFCALREIPVSSAFINMLRSIQGYLAPFLPSVYLDPRVHICSLLVGRCLKMARHLQTAHGSIACKGRDWRARFLDTIDKLIREVQSLCA